MGKIREVRRVDRPRRQRRPVVYLICEGKETETRYFRRFRTRECLIEIVPKESQHIEALSLVQHTKDVLKQELYYPNDGDMVWCVFDRDDNTNQNLYAAEQLAEHLGYRVAFSNPCFELWILLHFRDQRAEMLNVEDVISVLRADRYLPQYEKNMDVYDQLSGRQAEAIARAEHRMDSLNDDRIRIISRESNPATTVHTLVQYLNDKRG